MPPTPRCAVRASTRNLQGLRQRPLAGFVRHRPICGYVTSSRTGLPTSSQRISTISNEPHRSTTATAPRRCYHSYDHPSAPGPFGPEEQAILSAAASHVPELGFSPQALAQGAKDAGYLDISTNLLPDGVFSLIRWHLVTQRGALAAKSQVLFGADEEAARLSLGQKVERLTWERLLANKEVIRRWPEALAIMAQPSYVPASLKELALLVDEIWFLVGDVSVDPSWYTKRGSLSAIYASTELFMTTDKSEGFEETRKFLRRRLQETQEVGGTLRSIGQWVGFTATAGLNVLRSKGVPV